jgi:hypothetical protein
VAAVVVAAVVAVVVAVAAVAAGDHPICVSVNSEHRYN